MLNGLNHVTLSVGDLSRSVGYYTELLGFFLRARWNNGAYLSLGDLWLCLTRDEKVRTGPLEEYSHIALSVDQADFEAFVRATGNELVEWNEDGGVFRFLLRKAG